MKWIKIYESFRTNLKTKIGLNDKEFQEACELCAEELYQEMEGSVPFEIILNDLHKGKP